VTDVPLDTASWGWPAAQVVSTEHLGRRCLAFADTLLIAPLDVDPGPVPRSCRRHLRWI